jgi:hypothetical protein
MSLAIAVGFFTAYPTNWWLVSKNLKHGLMTVRREPANRAASDHRPVAVGAGHEGHAA